MLLARGLLGPWVFGLPALVASCLWVGRDTLALDQADWVPLFGTVHFGLQAGFEELAVRRSRALGR